MSIISRLGEIRARIRQSDKGPWYAEGRNWDEPYESTTVYCVFHNGDTMDRDLVAEVAYDNAEFIAHAREDVPYLLAIAERVQALLEQYEADDREHLNTFGQHHPYAGWAADHLREALEGEA